ncbi:hypothetical protein PCASD_08780 [Puccinia coronata f. sp. avenae]|uniref:Uncharacterized protein n=1 Tax=Puccinia coronata f. sp. avenae TaxID=200324 RepID=A0A2N5UPB5_9BASI|nr:hypothetical protein PCASD_08780 [Puccinia coronata f. sp. avenae]
MPQMTYNLTQAQPLEDMQDLWPKGLLNRQHRSFRLSISQSMPGYSPHPLARLEEPCTTYTVRNPVSHTVMRHPVARMTCLPASNPSCGDSDSPHGSVAASQPLSQHLSRCRSISGAVAASMA